MRKLLVSFLLRKLRECDASSPSAFAFIEVLEHVTGRSYVLADGVWYEWHAQGHFRGRCGKVIARQRAALRPITGRAQKGQS